MLKRILALILALFTLFVCVACADDKIEDEDTTEALTYKSESTSRFDDGVFRAGYAKVDITPTVFPILAAESTTGVFKNAKDPLYATCVAVDDGLGNTALIVTMDIKGTYEYIQTNMMKRMTEATGLPEENIMLSATHNHSAPASSDDSNKPKFSWDDTIYNWLDEVFAKMGPLALEAIEDLSPTEIFFTDEDTTGMAYVRRYIYEDGSCVMNGGENPVRHESDADPSLQILKFDREEKQDIVLTNWQAHVAHAVGYYPDSVTADIVYYVRDAVEKSGEYLYAYYAGASGNINLTAKIPIPGVPIYGDYRYVGKALGTKVTDALAADMEKLEAGEIKCSLTKVKAIVKKDDITDIRHAREIMESGYSSELMRKYGITSSYYVNAIVDRADLGRTDNIPIGAISFGEVAFVSAPYEMFDTSGMQVKDGSPFKSTFVLTCAGGNYDYMPDEVAYDNGAYEVLRCRYTKGTAEKLVAGFLKMLDEQYAEN